MRYLIDDNITINRIKFQNVLLLPTLPSLKLLLLTTFSPRPGCNLSSVFLGLASKL